MPSPNNRGKGVPEKNQRGSLLFRGKDLLTGRGSSAGDVAALTTPPRLTKLLLNVTIQRSLGAVRMVMPPEALVEDLIAAVLRQYAKEQRLPVLHSRDASEYDLHYSQFSLEIIDRDEKLVALGSRNFFLCPKTAAAVAINRVGAMT